MHCFSGRRSSPMSCVDMRALASCFALPENMAITSVHPTALTLTIDLACSDPTACCPLCHQPSERVHSTYQRTVADVPCSGRRVLLLLTVRKYICYTDDCPRSIFTERLPELVQSYARMTNRLREWIEAIGRAASGEVGARLAEQLGMCVSPTTILRRLMALFTPPVGTVSVLGIDDWSFRRDRKFGTILVDLTTHAIIDLLPDRSAETAAAWMRLHPEIEIVSRDRGEDYASCKWKEKVAALGRDTCRFLPQIVRKVALSITQHEEILAVIPNEEAIHCHHFERYDTLPVSPSGRINETGATHDQTP